ncbi:MAG: 1-acyl-sn-glycerol-3-phosphate acyltransferase [Bacteroidota bacterium]
MNKFFALLFRLAGWRVKGVLPATPTGCIIAAAPHSSNWDFFIGLGVRGTLNFHAAFLGKEELFRPPYGWIFRKLGGIPVNRSMRSDLVQQVTDWFRQKPDTILALAPEGTRTPGGAWKTGFYHMAFQSGVPIVFCSIDYPSREVILHTPFTPSGDYRADVPKMMTFFNGKMGKHRGILPMVEGD